MFHANCLREEPARFGSAKRAGEKSRHPGDGARTRGLPGPAGLPEPPHAALLRAQDTSGMWILLGRGFTVPSARLESIGALEQQPRPMAGGGCVPAPHPPHHVP